MRTTNIMLEGRRGEWTQCFMLQAIRGPFFCAKILLCVDLEACTMAERAER